MDIIQRMELNENYIDKESGSAVVMADAVDEIKRLREALAGISQVCERWLHLDQLLSDPRWTDGSPADACRQELWLAVKAAAQAKE